MDNTNHHHEVSQQVRIIVAFSKIYFFEDLNYSNKKESACDLATTMLEQGAEHVKVLDGDPADIYKVKSLGLSFLGMLL